MHPRVYLALARALAIALLVPGAADAYGPTGHQVVGDVAGRYLCTGARTEVRQLLAGESLADAGVWPDQIRSQPEWALSKPWHYLNVPDGGSVARAAGASPDNLLAALARFQRDLGNRRLPVVERRIALRFVVHLVADVHQPLHVGRREDRGGNTIEVEVQRKATTLHAVWDGELLLKGEPGGARKTFARLPWVSAAQRAAWQASGPPDWARESLRLRPTVYARLTPEPDPEYLARAGTLTRWRLLQAGVRLAGLLEGTLGCGSG